MSAASPLLFSAAVEPQPAEKEVGCCAMAPLFIDTITNAEILSTTESRSDVPKGQGELRRWGQLRSNILRINLLGGVSQHRRPIGDEQEVERTGDNQQVSGSGGRDVARFVIEVELSGSRDVDVSAGLVGSGIEAEVDQHRTGILRCEDVGSAKGVWHVVAEEGGLGVDEDVDSMGLDLDGVNGGSRHGVSKFLNGGLAVEFDTCGIIPSDQRVDVE